MPSVSGTQNGAQASSRPAAGSSSSADADTDTDTDLVLAAERAHLRAAHAFLRLMRENVLSLRALGGDPVSEEYLKADPAIEACVVLCPPAAQPGGRGVTG